MKKFKNVIKCKVINHLSFFQFKDRAIKSTTKSIFKFGPQILCMWRIIFEFILNHTINWTNPANTRRWPHGGLMLSQHRRWMANISFHPASRNIFPIFTQCWDNLAGGKLTLNQYWLKGQVNVKRPMVKLNRTCYIITVFVITSVIDCDYMTYVLLSSILYFFLYDILSLSITILWSELNFMEVVWPNVGLMLAKRFRRWPNISPTLGRRIVFAGVGGGGWGEMYIFFRSRWTTGSERERLYYPTLSVFMWLFARV